MVANSFLVVSCHKTPTNRKRSGNGPIISQYQGSVVWRSFSTITETCEGLCTVEPPNSVHVGPALFSFIERLSSCWRLKYTLLVHIIKG